MGLAGRSRRRLMSDSIQRVPYASIVQASLRHKRYRKSTGGSLLPRSASAELDYIGADRSQKACDRRWKGNETAGGSVDEGEHVGIAREGVVSRLLTGNGIKATSGDPRSVVTRRWDSLDSANVALQLFLCVVPNPSGSFSMRTGWTGGSRRGVYCWQRHIRESYCRRSWTNRKRRSVPLVTRSVDDVKEPDPLDAVRRRLEYSSPLAHQPMPTLPRDGWNIQ